MMKFEKSQFPMLDDILGDNQGFQAGEVVQIGLEVESGSSEPVEYEHLCDVCHKNPSIGVYASSCGPISFAYCKECAVKGAEPYGALVAYLATAVDSSVDLKPEREWIRPEYQKIIDASLQVADKTRKEFYTDVDKAIQEMYEEMNKWYAEQEFE
jgi:hypothetical protein